MRYTDDKKIATPYETQLLLAPGILAGGLIGRGLVASPDIKQKWGRLTGRLVIDWKPEISGLSDLLVYGSYSRGYKGGGANPPSIGFDPEKLRIFKNSPTFDPESIDAFEVGLKLATDDRKFNLSTSAFYYDYSGYQISQIVDRMALNENFDAIMFGFDLEIFYKPTTRFSLNGNLGLLKSRIKNGEESIDVMDRTQGNPDWVVVKPWLQLASNCIVPVATVAAIIDHPRYLITGPGVLSALCGGAGTSDFRPGSRNATRFGISYDPATAPGSGRGFMAPLGGNELPSAPNWTMNLGAQYELPVSDWITTFRFDYYRQGSSWARVYNTEIDKLRSWDNVNFSIRLSNPKNDVNFEFYVKNIFDKDSITDSFPNSDDSGLTLNIFTVDPRIFGLSSSIKF